jgi:hypothetical protein
LSKAKLATKTQVNIVDQAEDIASKAERYGDYVPRESFIPTYAELERLVDEFIAITPKASRLTARANASLIVHVATKGQKNCYGYFQPDAYTKGGKTVHQVTMCAETFQYGTDQIVSTLIHEMVHATNHLAGVNDCNNNRHNSNFKALAELFGLIVEKGSVSQGWAITSMSAELKQWVDELIKPDADAFTLLANIRATKEKKPSKMVKWECDCTIVRCATALNATCEECGQPFVQA